MGMTMEDNVIYSPVKLGQKIWLIRDNKIIETHVEKIILKQGGLYIKLACNASYETTCRSIGKTVFLSKEDCEEKFREGSNQ